MVQNAYEQYMLELVNRARLDPAAEATLYGVDLGTISATSKQPLAANDLLLGAAENHSQWMLDTDTFSHTGAGGSDPGDRMAAAGYTFTGSWAWGENIAWQGTTGTLNLIATIDAEHAALFQSLGHRENILNDTFQEVGVGIRTGVFGAYNAAMVTQDFAKSGTGAFLTGVAYTDTDGNDFYSVGEGRGGVQIAAQLVGGATTTVTTDAPGGYDSKLAAGTYNVTMSGGGLGAALGMTITMAGRNIKLDLLGTTAVACSASLIMGANLIGLTLLGTDDLSGTGNALANVIEGNKGANLIDGGAGADTLTGGAGNDTFILKAGQANGDLIGDFTGNGSAAGDSIKFDGFSAAATLTNTSGNHWQIVDGSTIETFTINGAVNAADYSFVNVGTPPPPPPPPPDPTGNETLAGTDAAETLSGGGGNDQLSGLGGNDTIAGGDGNDTLDGGTGNDAMAGGLGDDSYVIDSSSDSITEAVGGGIDTVQSTIAYVLGTNLENLVLLGSASIGGTGNAADNSLTGNSGDNTLDGKAGADTMAGGAGNDTYLVDSLADQIVEGSGGGSDEIRSTVALTTATAFVENYTFLGTTAVNFSGNSSANRITGTAAADTLNGNSGDDTVIGGAGADSLSGGAGNDTYVIDSATDKISETGSDTGDTVQATIAIDLNLVAFAGIENVRLTGTAAINATGSGVANHLIGNDGANVLDGRGGVDTLEGGKGNDTYLVDNSADSVIEVAGGGTDTVKSMVAYTLADPFVENLTLLAGAGAIGGTGNDLANVITGNESANLLDGGAGNDTLVGGLGDDTYLVNATGDVITEAASAGTDTVQSTAASYTLATNVENLVLLAGAATGNGNSAANVITGNDGDNLLDGKGGADRLDGGAGADTLIGGSGADTLVGGTGHDHYVVNNITDYVDESTGAVGDVDSVESSITYNLTANGTTVKGDIENLTLTGTSAINGTGNALHNVITGNAAANILDGGAGNDTLIGAAGNDTLIGGNGNDQIDVSSGNDTVRYTSTLDGTDVVNGFDGNASGGQDTLNLDALFDSLGIAAANRAAHLSVDTHATSVDVLFDANGNGSFQTIATLNTTDAITVGADIVVGS
ncbi:MAG TPA: CAP domain-containing protein [Candidatus Angelobacter sp.]|nr:CAP domain-containing protein [Candidatus Angelobacter sp.]